MICIGTEAQPFFLYPNDAYTLLCGRGDFTCCQRHHYINERQIECDKSKVRSVLEVMLRSREEYLMGRGQRDRGRWVGCLKKYMVTGLPQQSWAHAGGSVRCSSS